MRRDNHTPPAFHVKHISKLLAENSLLDSALVFLTAGRLGMASTAEGGEALAQKGNDLAGRDNSRASAQPSTQC